MADRWGVRKGRILLGAISLIVVMAALGPVTPSNARHERPLYREPNTLTRMAGDLFFVASDRRHGLELWKTAGTGSSTRIVRDIRTGLKSYGEAHPERVTWLTRWKGDLYFLRNTQAHGDELWRSDGSKEGTHIVKDIPGGDLDPRELTIFEDSIYFIGTSKDPDYESQLWKTDGTERGTVMVADPDASSIDHLRRVGQSLFFNTDDGTTGEQSIWVSDGTAAGTQQVRTVIVDPPAAPSFCPRIEFLFEAGGLVYFPVAEGTSDEECNEDLWRSDGTFEGTFKLRESNLPEWGSSRVYEMNGEAIFVGRDPEHSRELWKSDGTPEGTTMIKDINPGPGPSQVTAVAHYHYSRDPVLDGRFYFDANDGAHGSELWTTDGTEEGTKLLADIRRGAKGGHPHNFEAIESRGLVFFIADDGRHGYELWKTDGTVGGTRMIKDINPHGDGFVYDGWGPEVTPLGSKLYFFASDGEHPLELWRTDGTRRGTKPVAHL